MALPKYLNHDSDFTRVEHIGVTDFNDLKTKFETFTSGNGWSVAASVSSSSLVSSIRNDVNKGLELINVKLDADTLSAGQRNNSGTLEGLVVSKDLSGLTYPVNATFITDGTASASGSFVELVTEGGGVIRHFHAGLSNRERSQDNIKIAAGQTLSSGNLTVTVVLPKNSDDNYFYPDIYNIDKANFKPNIRAFSQSTADSEVLALTDVQNINTGAGTADITVSSCVGSYGQDSLLGLTPQPITLTEGLSGQTIENGAVEAITLRLIGEKFNAAGARTPPAIGVDPDVLTLGYATPEAELSGRVYGFLGISTADTPPDGQQGTAWKTSDPVLGRSEGKDRLFELRVLTSGDRVVVPKTNYAP